MFITDAFLAVKFTEVSLLHILILLGIPYIIFYLFERFTKFDKFFEKWEAALFVFVGGGIITLLSLLLRRFTGIPFGFLYFILMIIFIFILLIIKLAFFNNKKETSDKWVLIKLKNGERFKGIIANFNSHFIKIVGNKSNKIVKLEGKNPGKEVSWKSIQLNTSEVEGIYSI